MKSTFAIWLVTIGATAGNFAREGTEQYIGLGEDVPNHARQRWPEMYCSSYRHLCWWVELVSQRES
jgi:hypothetical protein